MRPEREAMIRETWARRGAGRTFDRWPLRLHAYEQLPIPVRIGEGCPLVAPMGEVLTFEHIGFDVVCEGVVVERIA